MEKQLTLTELNSLIKETLQNTFFDNVWIVAEISELKTNRTGHCYIELVDKDSTTDEITARSRATIWSWQFRFIQPYFETTTGQTLQAGIKIMVAVSVEFHEVYGISLNIKDIDPNYTLGDLARKRRETIDKLKNEGIFDMNRELDLPEIPNRLAIISSPTAAGYEDFINQLYSNNKGYKFYTKLFPALMQGNDSPTSIINALNIIYNYEEYFDAVVIIRGGGSQIDLNCFDNYDLAYHITQFPLPVITGIGHDKDESVADLVAHTKLKTPTAVAEFLISKLDEIADELFDLQQIFKNEIFDYLNTEILQLTHLSKLLKPITKSNFERSKTKLNLLVNNIKPVVSKNIEKQQYLVTNLQNQINQLSISYLKEKTNKLIYLISKVKYVSKHKTFFELQQLDEKKQKLKRILSNNFDNQKRKITWLNKANELVNPKNVLKRGYSITTLNGKPLKNCSELNENDTINTVLYNGKITSTVVNKQ